MHDADHFYNMHWIVTCFKTLKLNYAISAWVERTQEKTTITTAIETSSYPYQDVVHLVKEKTMHSCEENKKREI